MEEINQKLVSRKLEIQMIKLGDKIRAMRVKEGITQQSLAFYILTDKCVISNLERGGCNNVTVHTLMKIAEVFNIELVTLLSD